MKYLGYITLTFIFALVLSVFVAIGTAYSKTIKIEVLGLVCDFCSQSIWKTFMLERETENVYVDLENGIVEIVTKQDMTDQKINQLLQDAGYTVSKITRK